MAAKVVSLFSGGGGLDLGFKAAGFKIIWAIDNNQNAVNTYKANIGEHIICEDINKIDVKDIPHADIVIGGPPCQSFSLAGNRNADDDRGKLVWTYISIIKEIKPKAFLFENVTGLLSAKNAKGEKVIDLLKTAFREIGYTITMQVVNAADYGVPQRRKRVIIVGLKGGAKFLFPPATHNESGDGLKKYVSAEDALDDLPKAICNENGRAVYSEIPRTEYQKRMRGGREVTEHFVPQMSELDKFIVSHVKPGGNYMDIPSEVASGRIRRLQRDGGHTTCYGRMKPDEPSYTINTYFNRPNVGCNIHYREDRLITVREALRLQSFPDSYVIVSSSKQGRNLIVGNAVPPMLAEIMAKELKKYIDGEKRMISYADSEVKTFHPLCEEALNQALKSLGLSREYEVLHHQYVEKLEMDYVIRNIHTQKYLCVIEVKRTPADVQSTRYQIQAQSYVQMNHPQNEKPFYVLTNLEKLISFRYDTSKPRVYQQMLAPGMESICDFSMDDESTIVKKLAAAFAELIDKFKKDKYQYLSTLDQFLSYMNTVAADDKRWKSSMAMLMYEYIRGAFRAVRRSEIKYDIRKFHDDVEQVCIEANKVDFDGIFAYDSAKYLPRLKMPAAMFSDIYKYGNINISGDLIADALHSMISANKRHDGEVATDLELASLAAVLAKISNGPLSAGKKICDPAAGSGNLICSSINIFNAEPNQLIANDINPKLIELLSLRLGLSFPKAIAKPNAAQVTSNDIVNLDRADFEDVEVLLLNPPFVAGINCVNRKIPFYNKIKELKGSEATTKVGQMNLGAVFLETVCHLAKAGTTIVCIFPKAHLTERGEEAVAFRRMLLDLFGLHTIFNYPAEGLFDSVTEETCVFAGKIMQKAEKVIVYSSDEKVADIDLHELQNITEQYCRTDFATVFPGVEARELDWTELDAAAEGGWRIVCSEMSEAVQFIESSIKRCKKLTNITNTTNIYRKGKVGVNGGSDLTFFDSIDALYTKYEGSVTLEEGMRNAKSNDFILNSGDSKFLDFNGISSGLAASIAKDYTMMTRTAGKQQRKVKSAGEWETIAKKYGKVRFSKNSVLIPTKTRKRGRIHLSSVPLYVSTNFAVFTYPSMDEAEIAASYMTTVFYQLECEVMCKNHAGVRKGEVGDIITTHVPMFADISPSEIQKIQDEVSNIRFLDLNKPSISKMDEIWAEILFGADAGTCLEDACRLLRFLANRRNLQ